MQRLTIAFLLAQQLCTTCALRVLDNGLGLEVFGDEETIVDFAVLATDQKASLPSQVENRAAFDKTVLFSSQSARRQLLMLS